VLYNQYTGQPASVAGASGMNSVRAQIEAMGRRVDLFALGNRLAAVIALPQTHLHRHITFRLLV
jgi:hypothetical protein